MRRNLREFFSLVGVFEKFFSIKNQAFDACFLLRFNLKNNIEEKSGFEHETSGL